jgi:glycosyltransferase involved in cell wall biosynthesis
MPPPSLHSIHFSPWDYTLSGANRSMLTLVAELARRSLGTVFCLHDGEVAAEARRLRIPVFTAYRGDTIPRTRIGRFCRVLRAFRRAAREQNAAILHCHSAAGMHHARYLARAAGLRLVCHQRDNYVDDAFHAYLGKADRIVAISNWVYSTLPARLQKKATVIHNAVLASDDAASAPPLVEPRGAVRVGMAGRCVPEKGFDIFLEAAARLAAERVEFEVWGVDADPAEGTYAHEIRSRLCAVPDHVRHRIHIQPFRPDIGDFFRLCDIVVVPSRFAEPFGRMAIEAMACGRPVVAAAHGGLTEIITDGVNGRLFAPGDAAALAAVVRELIDSPGMRHRLGAQGARDAVERFSSSAHCDAMLKLYRTLPGRAGAWRVLSNCSAGKEKSRS